MSAGDVAEGVGPSDDGQAEGECYAQEPDAQWEPGVAEDPGGEHSGTTAAEDEDECAQRLSGQAGFHIVSLHSLIISPSTPVGVDCVTCRG